MRKYITVLLLSLGCGTGAGIAVYDAGNDSAAVDASVESPAILETVYDSGPEPPHNACPPWCKVGNRPPNRFQ